MPPSFVVEGVACGRDSGWMNRGSQASGQALITIAGIRDHLRNRRSRPESLIDIPESLIMITAPVIMITRRLSNAAT